MLPELIVAVLAVPLLLGSGYLLALTLLSRKPSQPGACTDYPRFLLVVPAHDEAQGIARTVHSLRTLDWPPTAVRLLIVADNCTDDTAALARAAGAEVIERHNDSCRGKGYALQSAYGHALEQGWADAVVVIDADTDSDPGLLRALAPRLAAGALAIQVFYGVRNPLASWRTRLLSIALALFHRVRGRARERLGVSCGLRGNGMCFAVPVLEQVPHQAYSLVEDLEYGLALGRAGIRVWYVDEVSVRADMVSYGAAARSQRQRWEGGRLQFARAQGVPLLREALRRRSGLLLDLALDVLLPPLAYLGFAAALLGLGAGLAAWNRALDPALAALALLPLAMLLIHLARGVMLSGLGARGWLDLAAAPLYLGWKLSMLLSRAPTRWIRTAREDGPRL